MQNWEKVKKNADLIVENQYLAISAAKRYARNDADFKDLVQEGIIGLVDAAVRFDPKRNTRFKTMAYPWVLKRVRESHLLQRVIKTPIYLEWKNKLVDNVAWLLRKQGATFTFTPYDDVCGMGKTLPNQYAYVRMNEKKKAVNEALEALTDLEYFSMYYYYHDEETLEVIGKRFNITREAVRVMLLRAIQKIRKHIAFADLKHQFGLQK